MGIYPVIMAGGSGTRFWPVSRANYPKQFLSFIGSKTMIEETLKRVNFLCPEDNIIIVSNAEHHQLLITLVGENRFVVLEEPLGRSTAPCIGLAAIYLRKKGITDEPMVVLPADHFIFDEEKFRDIILIGCRLAEVGHIVTVSIVPTRPETGYGYLQRGGIQSEMGGVKVYAIRRFVEKPDKHEALKYLETKEYYWNSGIFIFTPQIILEEIKLYLPEVYEGLLEIEGSIDRSNFPEVLHSAYQRFPAISLDYGVMEKTNRSVLTIPGNFGWSDVGSWESLYDLRQNEKDQEGNLVQGKALYLETKSSFLFNQSHQMLIGLGLKDILIVNTEDAILVADLKKSQEIKKVIEELKARGFDSIL